MFIPIKKYHIFQRDLNFLRDFLAKLLIEEGLKICQVKIMIFPFTNQKENMLTSEIFKKD